MKQLIINADDFGLTAGVSAGIVEAISHGVVSSTTAMVCQTEAAENIPRFAGAIRERIGLHLQLTDGSPCAPPEQVRSLLDERGAFPRSWRNLGTPKPDEIRREWRAQMERICDLGIRPTHIDTHHHVHRLPAVFEVYAELAATYRLPARALTWRMAKALGSRGVASADYCEIRWPDGAYRRESILNLLTKAFAVEPRAETIELMCHPGFCDEELGRKTTYSAERYEELKALCDPDLPASLAELGIEIIAPSCLSAQRVNVGVSSESHAGYMSW